MLFPIREALLLLFLMYHSLWKAQVNDIEVYFYESGSYKYCKKRLSKTIPVINQDEIAATKK